GLSFVFTTALNDSRHNGSFDVVFCMEVLEHCTEATRREVLLDLRRLVAPAGTVVISVPIEIGPSLIGKQLIRGIAGARGVGDYKYLERYTWKELTRMVLACEHTVIERPVFQIELTPGQPTFFHGHKGFNWRTCRRELNEFFSVQRVLFSPLG